MNDIIPTLTFVLPDMRCDQKHSRLTRATHVVSRPGQGFFPACLKHARRFARPGELFALADNSGRTEVANDWVREPGHRSRRVRELVARPEGRRRVAMKRGPKRYK